MGYSWCYIDFGQVNCYQLLTTCQPLNPEWIRLDMNFNGHLEIAIDRPVRAMHV